MKNDPSTTTADTLLKSLDVVDVLAKPKIQEEILTGLFKEIIIALKQDITDPGLVDTPGRMARAYMEFLNYEDLNTETTFEAIQTDQMVIVKNIEGYSLCQHHLLPFHVNVHVGYITGKKVIGLSKIPRIVQKHCHKLQLQEGLCSDIAAELQRVVEPLGVIVMIEGKHMCMAMRGARSGGTMITSHVSGAFAHNVSSKNEFFNLLGIAST